MPIARLLDQSIVNGVLESHSLRRLELCEGPSLNSAPQAPLVGQHCCDKVSDEGTVAVAGVDDGGVGVQFARKVIKIFVG